MSLARFFDRLLAALAGGDEPSRDAPAPAPRPDAPPPATRIEFDLDDPRVPETSRRRVETVRTLLAEVEARAAAKGIAGSAVIDLRQMRDNHLPGLLKSYVEIPAEHRAEIFRKTGHSASYILNDGLDQMAARLREMSRELAQGDIEAFAVNMRFIETRYGEQYSPFD